MLDIGANIGNHTCFFSLFCADNVIAIEPVLENYEKLLQNVKDNNLKNVVCINKVFSSKKQNYKYNIIPNNMGMCNMIETIDLGVESITPEDIDYKNLTLIKIDCEAMSIEIFNSLIPIILTTKCDIVIEANDFELKQILNKIPYKIMGKFNATPTYYLKPI
jgi:FkbM family methyltransferase